MTPSRKLSQSERLDKLTKSHMRLLKVQRGLITEIGHLRRLLLAMYQTKNWTLPPNISRAIPEDWNNLPGYGPWRSGNPNISTSGAREFDVPPNDWPRL